jgi:hypothetical protein
MCKARIENVLEGDVVLKNLSITGCCLECSANFDNLKPNEKYTIDIEPEKVSHIDEFNLEVECRWIRKRNNICEIGFQIVASPKGKGFQSYVDYLTYHSSLI